MTCISGLRYCPNWTPREQKCLEAFIGVFRTPSRAMSADVLPDNLPRDQRLRHCAIQIPQEQNFFRRVLPNPGRKPLPELGLHSIVGGSELVHVKKVKLFPRAQGRCQTQGSSRVGKDHSSFFPPVSEFWGS